MNSVPKSGTNLLLQIIEGIPNIQRMQEDELFQLQKGAYVTSHLPYEKSLARKLQENEIKHLLIYRDLRDVTVSLRHFINDKFPEHPLHKVFQERLVTKDEQLNALIMGIDLIGEEQQNKWGIMRYPGVYDEYRLIYEWTKDPSVCSVRFEDLIEDNNKDEAILSIIEFLFDDFTIQEKQKNLLSAFTNDFRKKQKVIKETKQTLLQLMKDNINPSQAWTFRKGKKGGWREEFTVEHKEKFKKITGDFLLEYGYEKNQLW
ncbi:sulfotransferase domain-containing protein [Alkalihalobacterium bogoriense]|uniref:sulfotransferase domain-containing protein n=1 Tax=Alkalihalobacterium bogoriense TaxID=246272 RepID=UPI00068571F8|nr:sulfotransferase domain-containing protein [Alkalihalobacterium bogoriense]